MDNNKPNNVLKFISFLILLIFVFINTAKINELHMGNEPVTESQVCVFYWKGSLCIL